VTRIASLAAAATALSLLIAGCTTPPRPAVTAAPAAPPPRAPAPPPVDIDWRDLPLSPGGWSYSAGAASSSASFGPPAAPVLVIHCDKAARRIRFALPAAAVGPGTITITTSYGGRDLPLAPGATGGLEASLPAADPFLDRIAFSRGRVSYAVPGRPLLMVPAWAEPARVIEDCRG
jgi:hypothetical protein